MTDPSETEELLRARFDSLQKKLVPLWKSIQTFTTDPQTIVVVPSISVEIELTPAEIQGYEERYLFLLLLLRQPNARMVYVTSGPIQLLLIDYVLSLLPSEIREDARSRLFLVSARGAIAGLPLCRILLETPALVDRIRSLIPDRDRAHLVPFNATTDDRDLALELGIPMYAADPKFLPLGTKSGCRRLFREEGVLHPAGAEGLRSVDDLVQALAALRLKRPDLKAALLKTNEGVSGEGNASVSLVGLPGAGAPEELQAIRERLGALLPEEDGLSVEAFLARFERGGGVVEERVSGAEFHSPSVQLRVTPFGEVELLSTHDQLLGGETGSTYLGCVFPCDPGYAREITREAEKVGRRLATEGVLGRFAIDFVVARNVCDPWRIYAIELNLRKGGTTHPFLTLQFLTNGTYDPERAVFATPSGAVKALVASDHVENPAYRALRPEDLIRILSESGLHYRADIETGVVLHMLSPVTEVGRFGLTAIANSRKEALALYEETVAAFDRAAR